VLIFGLLILAAIFHQSYHVPAEVSSSYVVVIGILAITKESKHFYKQMKCEVEDEDEKKAAKN